MAVGTRRVQRLWLWPRRAPLADSALVLKLLPPITFERTARGLTRASPHAPLSPPASAPWGAGPLIRKAFFVVAGHCRCASTIRGQIPHCATPESRENAGVGRPFALCIVRVMLSRIDSDPIHQILIRVSVRQCGYDV